VTTRRRETRPDIEETVAISVAFVIIGHWLELRASEDRSRFAFGPSVSRIRSGEHLCSMMSIRVFSSGVFFGSIR
jgi:hypothetical protein